MHQNYLVLSFLSSVGQERRLSYKHLVQDHSHAPPITKLRVATAQKDFRCYVVWRSDD